MPLTSDVISVCWKDLANYHNLYGIELISHCVGSDFKGPCLDTRYPVPCADNTCKATYIDCLKSLQLLEQQYRERSYPLFPLNKHQAVTEWEFNQEGLLKAHDTD